MSTPSCPTFGPDVPPSPERKRSYRSKETNFFNKYGHLHHTYDPEKAPYPLSYDKEVLGLDLLDHGFMLKVQTSVSHVEWKDGPPTSVLDLGCGTGAWIIDAAKQWPHCQFVGFDLVNIQPPAAYLDRSIADRIRWVHGNFLTTKLPFEDEEFDLVRMKGVSRGVPENKWAVLYQDIHRVLCAGGVMESVEEDIRFPTLPRWFTTPLRARSRRSASIHLPDGSQVSANPSACKDDLQHDHALLESLYYSIFESRFINAYPTAILPAYASAVFRRVRVAPVYNMKMPPFAPVLPSPESEIVPPPVPQIPADIANQLHIDSYTTPISSIPMFSECSPVELDFSGLEKEDRDDSSSSWHSVDNPTHDDAKLKRHPSQLNISYAPAEETTSVSFTLESNKLVIPMKELMALAPETMATQLYRAYSGVLACQEAMWEELKDRLRNRPEELRALGWDDDEELEELQGRRKKFETLLQRYRDDMHYRVAFWYSWTKLGWELPAQGPLTRAEIIEEDRLRQAMLDARKFAREEDTQTPCRSIRVIVGIKDV